MAIFGEYGENYDTETTEANKSMGFNLKANNFRQFFKEIVCQISSNKIWETRFQDVPPIPFIKITAPNNIEQPLFLFQTCHCHLVCNVWVWPL